MSYLRPLLSVTLVKRNALRSFLGDAAAELPAHQRMHLGVFVYRPRNPDEEPGSLQRF